MRHKIENIKNGRKENLKFVKKKSIIAIISIMAVLAFSVSAVSALLTPGQLSTQGSSTVLPVSQAMLTDYENWMLSEHGITITATAIGGGSGDGVGGIIGTKTPCDVGAASREPKATEWNYVGGTAEDMRIYGIGLDSLAVIVGDELAAAGLQDLTAAQAGQLFTDLAHGGYSSWEEANTGMGLGLTLTGGPHYINRVLRPLDSGTHDGFTTFILDEYIDDYDNAWLNENATDIENNGQVVDYMKASTGDWTIAYLGLGFLTDPALNAVNLSYDGGVTYSVPSKEGALSGDYPPIRWLYYITEGEPELEEHLWIAYCMKDAYENGASSYIEFNGGYINKYRGDMAGRANTDALSPIHPSLPDNVLNSDDLFAFVGGYIDYFQAGTLNPYIDFDATGTVSSDDLFAFIGEYIAYYS